MPLNSFRHAIDVAAAAVAMADIKDRKTLSLQSGPATEDQQHLISKEASTATGTGLSSLLSKINVAGHGQLTTVKPLTSPDSGRSLAVSVSDVHARNSTSAGDLEPPAIEPLDNQSRSKSLMKRLGSLLYPKKKPKGHSSNTRKPQSRGAASDLELLFAQAEATLGELLVRAGASFSARSSSDHLHHQTASSNGGAAVAAGSSSSSRAAVGHVRRNSLSRVWQQVGERVFCGSGHMSGVVEEMELRGMAPLAQPVYFGDAEEDLVLDEEYWQSLAESMLMQQRGKAQPSNAPNHHDQYEHSIIEHNIVVEASHDEYFSTQPQSHPPHEYGEEEGEEECSKSEIVPSADIIDEVSEQDMCQVAIGGTVHSSIYHRKLLPVGGDSSTRLNTTLDDSPNLVHNHQQRMAAARVRSMSSSVVDYSPPTAATEPAPTATAAIQPLEKFLWQARAGGSTSPSWWCDGSGVGPSSSSSSVPESISQPPVAGAPSCTRVSLMALLHEEKEEAAASDSPIPTSTGSTELQQQQQEEEEEESKQVVSSTLVGEDPLLCCVCMVGRKGAALIPCGHTFCRSCTKQLFAGRGACPLCNNLIAQVLDIF